MLRVLGFVVVHRSGIRPVGVLRAEASSATTISVIVCLAWFFLCALLAKANRSYTPEEKAELLRKGGT
jgi:hypothetical protein